MKDGNSEFELDINEIDAAIRHFILTLNSYDGIETTGSCSGHPQDGKARCYINFLDTGHINLEEVLDFFKELGFKVFKPTYDNKWWAVDSIIEKSSGDVIIDDIEAFWVKIDKMCVEMLGIKK
jgi:hypothetical protein